MRVVRMKISYSSIFLFTFFVISFLLIIKYLNESSKKDHLEIKFFVSSSYYYPKSKSLGDNSIAIVMNTNTPVYSPEWMDLEFFNTKLTWPIINILAKNETHSVRVSKRYQLITHHFICHLLPVFVTAELLPNLQSLYMISENNKLTKIPFEIPPNIEHKVRICVSPLFVNEQWRTFLFSIHIYKHFGAHMHIYISSVIDSIFDLIQEYENEGYLSVQPWIQPSFPGVPDIVANPKEDVEFRNQAVAQTDCLLRFKETSEFISFFDFDEILIPRLAPTYYEEFSKIMHSQKNIAYVTYEKENFEIETLAHGTKYSFSKMFRSLKLMHERETGKIVVNPKLLNHTWIHFPSFLPKHLISKKVSENVLTHLKKINKVDNFSYRRISKFSNNSKFLNINATDLAQINKDTKRMLQKSKISKIIRRLPISEFYQAIVSDCYYEKYYFYDGIRSVKKCPGPFMCEYPQRDDLKCVHSTSSPQNSHTTQFYYSTNIGFSREIGCYP